MSDSEKPQSWKERRQTIKHKWLVPFIFAEWLCEWLSYLLGRWAFIDILGYAGRFVILVGVISYVRGCPERQKQAEDQRKAKHYQAWQVISVSQGRQADGGRKDALEDLNKDGVSLAGVDISKAFLPELNLAKADLTHANFTGAVAWNADLTGAGLEDANLAGARLVYADLPGADLSRANLAGANLRDTNLAGARLSEANLHDAYLTNIDYWRDIRSIKLANIYGVKNPPEGFMEWATAPEQGAVLIRDEEEWNKLLATKFREHFQGK